MEKDRKSQPAVDRKFSVAPMMDWTDRHCRYFHRILSRRAVLYTEMVTADAVIHGDRRRLLGFASEEHPVVLQLGGSNPKRLAEAARIGEDFGYDEINLNVGCPSDRVQSGRFGACLMLEPQLVADCIDAMQKSVSVPVTVKCRIGVDEQDEEEALNSFVDCVAVAGCRMFAVHARKAWLSGLSPRENREVPPLNYPLVYALKKRRPDLEIAINGGIASVDECVDHLRHVDGVMIGRAAYQHPWMLADVDGRLYGGRHAVATRDEALLAFVPYVARQLGRGLRLNQMTRHILGLYQGLPGARAFRRVLSERAHLPGAGIDVLRDAMACVSSSEAAEPEAVTG